MGTTIITVSPPEQPCIIQSHLYIHTYMMRLPCCPGLLPAPPPAAARFRFLADGLRDADTDADAEPSS